MKPGDTGSISENLTKTLGSSNLMLSNLRQMQHQLNFMSSHFKLSKDTFMLKDEINYCIEGLSVNLGQNSSFKFTHDDRLPDLVICDLEKFRLALITVAEFAMKHSVSGLTILRTNHEGLDATDRKTTKVSF